MTQGSKRDRAWEALGLGPDWRPKTPGDGGALSAVVPAAAPAAPDALSAVRGEDDAAGGDMAAAPSARPPAGADWETLRGQALACRACRLCETRRQVVFGVGDPQAVCMVVGEAPGAEEDRRGEPFVGEAGQLLDQMLLAVGLSRERGAYIANVLKCRPPANRDPQPDEISMCRPFLQAQIRLLGPRLILALGRFSAQVLLDTDARVGALRNRAHVYRIDETNEIPVVVGYHPAYYLRRPEEKRLAWEDLLRVRRLLAAG